jgi:hypothetical protein
MPVAFFVVRATVTDPAKRAAFDKWYQDEHLPDATRSWGVKKAVALLEPFRSIAAPGDLSIRR